MLSGLHCLRSASNEMPSPFSASSGQSTKYLARFSRHRRSAAMALTRCYASPPSLWPIQAVPSTLLPEPSAPAVAQLLAAPRVLEVASWVLSTLRLVAAVVVVARFPIRRLLALRAAVLRLAVSQLALPSTAAPFSAFALAARQSWQSREGSSCLPAVGRANA